jgi:hypothetical protein
MSSRAQTFLQARKTTRLYYDGLVICTEAHDCITMCTQYRRAPSNMTNSYEFVMFVMLEGMGVGTQLAGFLHGSRSPRGGWMTFPSH